MIPRSVGKWTGLLFWILAVIKGGSFAQEAAPGAPIRRNENPSTDKVETARLEPVTVEAVRVLDETKIAADVQRSSVNIVSVVATSELGPVVDSNPGEFLKYVPGVDVEPVAPGFNRYSVHGLGAENTEILFDGLPLANIHGERVSRRFDVSLVSAADITRAEVRNLPLPSNSANSLGGTINLIRRSAFDASSRRITYQTWLRADAQKLTTDPLSLPDGQRWNRWRPNWQFSWTEPVTRDFGFSISLGQEDLLLSTQLSSLGWNLGTAANNAAAEASITSGGGVPSAISIYNPALISAVLLDAPQQQRKDYALARFDWQPRPELVLTGDFGVHDSRQRDVQGVYSWNAARDAGTGEVALDHDAVHTLGQPGGGSISHNNGVWREGTHVTTNVMLAATWTDKVWELGAKGGWSRAAFSFADTSNGYFGSTSVGSVPGLIDIPNTGVGVQTANPMPLLLRFHQDYWGLKQIDAWTTRPGLVSRSAADYNVPVDWQGNEVIRIGGARSRPGHAEEIITTAKVYAQRKFTWSAPTSVKAGFDWSESYLNRRYDYSAWRFVGSDGVPASDDDSAALISGEGAGARRDPTYGYPEPAPISVSKLYRLYQDHPDWFRYDAAHSERLALTSNSAYDLNEKVSAPYVEFDTRIASRLHLSGGLRHEHTQARARGLLIDNSAAYLRYADGSTVHSNDTNPGSVRADGRLVVNLGSATAVNYTLVNGADLLPTLRAGAPVFTAEIQGAGNAARAAGESADTDFNLGRGTLAHTRAVYHAKGATNTAVNDATFPSLHATYDLSEYWTLQAGYARTQGRIDFASALLPNNQVTDDLITNGEGAGAIGRVTVQNPNLQPWTADNFEARLSRYFGRTVIAVGGFRKLVRNFQPQVDSPPLSASDLAAYAKLFPDAGLGPEYTGYTLRYRTNTGSARLDGIEVELRTPLDEWLPTWTRHFDLSCAASFLNRTGLNGDELGLNRAWIGSANLRYAAGRWAIRAGYRFNGAQLVTAAVISNGRIGQTVREPQQLVDATVEFAIVRGLRVFLAGTNLINEHSVDEQRFSAKPQYANFSSSHNIGTTYTLGVAGSF